MRIFVPLRTGLGSAIRTSSMSTGPAVLTCLFVWIAFRLWPGFSPDAASAPPEDQERAERSEVRAE